ncbi:hypothetical protein E2C01_089644 [Portunus trituberculatus]|uniref:Uncharacterized protein n=1 Tax=Portunus trituberculatus TaxID=210409 RepID=A0A5B7JJC4_PORTR|nr:hypothetical protein [Portunus trituberculatus]
MSETSAVVEKSLRSVFGECDKVVGREIRQI